MIESLAHNILGIIVLIHPGQGLEQLLLGVGDDLLVLDDLFLLHQDLEHLLLISDDPFLVRNHLGKTKKILSDF